MTSTDSKYFGRVGGEPHQQYGTDGEIGDDQDADARVFAEEGLDLRQLRCVEPRRADDDVHAVIDTPPDVVECRIRLGEVERDLRTRLP